MRKSVKKTHSYLFKGLVIFSLVLLLGSFSALEPANSIHPVTNIFGFGTKGTIGNGIDNRTFISETGRQIHEITSSTPAYKIRLIFPVPQESADFLTLRAKIRYTEEFTNLIRWNQNRNVSVCIFPFESAIIDGKNQSVQVLDAMELYWGTTIKFSLNTTALEGLDYFEIAFFMWNRTSVLTGLQFDQITFKNTPVALSDSGPFSIALLSTLFIGLWIAFPNKFSPIVVFFVMIALVIVPLTLTLQTIRFLDGIEKNETGVSRFTFFGRVYEQRDLGNGLFSLRMVKDLSRAFELQALSGTGDSDIYPSIGKDETSVWKSQESEAMFSQPTVDSLVPSDSSLRYGSEVTGFLPRYKFSDIGGNPGWWNTSYKYVRQVNLTANSALGTNYTVQADFDTSTPVTASKMRADGNDLRVAYYNQTDSTWYELNRVILNNNSQKSAVFFRLQKAVSASSSDNNYAIFYGVQGNPGIPPNSTSKVFLDYDDFSSKNLNNYNLAANWVVALDTSKPTNMGWWITEDIALHSGAINDYLNRSNLLTTNNEIIVLGKLTTSAGTKASIHLRSDASPSDDLRVTHVSSSPYLRLERYNGTIYTLSSATGSFSTTTWYLYKFSFVGDTMKARVWKVGRDEPSTWNVTYTANSGDNFPSSGHLMFKSNGGMRIGMWALRAGVSTDPTVTVDQEQQELVKITDIQIQNTEYNGSRYWDNNDGSPDDFIRIKITAVWNVTGDPYLGELSVGHSLNPTYFGSTTGNVGGTTTIEPEEDPVGSVITFDGITVGAAIVGPNNPFGTDVYLDPALTFPDIGWDDANPTGGSWTTDFDITDNTGDGFAPYGGGFGVYDAFYDDAAYTADASGWSDGTGAGILQYYIKSSTGNVGSADADGVDVSTTFPGEGVQSIQYAIQDRVGNWANGSAGINVYYSTAAPSGFTIDVNGTGSWSLSTPSYAWISNPTAITSGTLYLGQAGDSIWNITINEGSWNAGGAWQVIFESGWGGTEVSDTAAPYYSANYHSNTNAEADINTFIVNRNGVATTITIRTLSDTSAPEMASISVTGDSLIPGYSDWDQDGAGFSIDRAPITEKGDFGLAINASNSETFANYRYMGGTSPSTAITVTHLWIRTTGSGTAAVALYTGGTLSNPTTATKQAEAFNVVVSAGWNRIDIPDTLVSADTIVWMSVALDTGLYYATSGNNLKGDWQESRGRWGQSGGADPTLASPTNPGSGSFAPAWYNMYMEYNGGAGGNQAVYDVDNSNPSFDLSSNDPYTYPVDIGADGTYTFYAVAVDRVGNKGIVRSDLGFVDETAPILGTTSFTDADYTNATHDYYDQGIRASATYRIPFTETNVFNITVVNMINAADRASDAVAGQTSPFDSTISLSNLFSDGEYTITITITDKVGRTDTTVTGGPTSIFLDNTDPVLTDALSSFEETSGEITKVYGLPVSNLFYFANSFTGGAIIGLYATGTDSGSGVRGIDFGVFGADNPAEDTVSPYRGQYTINNDDVSGTITVTIYDKVGNSASAAITATEDAVNPIISLTGDDSAAESSIYLYSAYGDNTQGVYGSLMGTTQGYTISGTASDATAGLLALSDNTTFGDNPSNTGSLSSWQFIYTIDAADNGDIVVVYTATDNVANNNTVTYTFFEDNSNPMITDPMSLYQESGDTGEVYGDIGTDIFYFSNSFSTSATVTFTATGLEAGKAGVRGIDFGSFGSDDPGEDTSAPFTGQYTIDGTDISGSITVTIYDNVGNSGSDTITCTEDTSSPTITITGETESSSYLYAGYGTIKEGVYGSGMGSLQSYTISGTASDADAGLLSITDDQSFGNNPSNSGTNSSWSFVYQIDAADSGNVVVTYTATDLVGNIATDAYTFNEDNTNPSISVTQAASATNESSIYLYYDNVSAFGYYSPNMLGVLQAFNVGGTASDALAGLASVTDDTTFGNNPARSGSLTSWSFGYQIDDGDSVYGTFTVTYTATDNVGNTFTDSFQFLFDNTNPTVSVDTAYILDGGSPYLHWDGVGSKIWYGDDMPSGQSLTVGIDAADASSGLDYAIAANQFGGTAAQRTDDTEDTNGGRTYDVPVVDIDATDTWTGSFGITVYDNVGNNLQTTVDFSRDTGIPSISVTGEIESSVYLYAGYGTTKQGVYSGSGMGSIQGFTISGTASDASAGLYSITDNSAFGNDPINTGTNASWSFLYQIDSGDNGDVTIAYTATDLVGNTAGDTYTFFEDGTNPTLTDNMSAYAEFVDTTEVYGVTGTDTFYFSNSFSSSATVEFTATGFDTGYAGVRGIDFGTFGGDNPVEDTSAPYIGQYTISNVDSSGSITVTIYDNVGNNDSGAITCIEDATNPSLSDPMSAYSEDSGDIADVYGVIGANTFYFSNTIPTSAVVTFTATGSDTGGA
ncbi:MAG: beta strand repeat-containing protein, partial [Candidatus Heimdallarchaeota archaeon]